MMRGPTIAAQDAFRVSRSREDLWCDGESLCNKIVQFSPFGSFRVLSDPFGSRYWCCAARVASERRSPIGVTCGDRWNYAMAVSLTSARGFRCQQVRCGSEPCAMLIWHAFLLLCPGTALHQGPLLSKAVAFDMRFTWTSVTSGTIA
jgi:hypothetical protein